LWKSEGNSDGTTMVKDINQGRDSSSPYGLTSIGDKLFFMADDGINGQELWVSNGTEDGTKMVMDINPDGDSQPFSMVDIDGINYFSADNGSDGFELWRSDGSEENTYKVKEINPNGDASPHHLTPVGDKLFFVADDGLHSEELWTSDGTADGTYLIKDINTNKICDERGNYPGTGSLACNANIWKPTNFNGVLFFNATDGIRDNELWRSDGTEEGTYLVKDINKQVGEHGYILTSLFLLKDFFFL
jgi:ELWxxDGT repeat protein